MAFNPLNKQAILAILLALHLAYNLHMASAASGGRMGGDFLSSTSKSSSDDSSSRIDEFDSCRQHPLYPHRSDYYPNRHFSSFGCEGDYPREVENGEKEGSGLLGVCIIAGMVGSFFASVYFSERKSVIKLQVGLRGTAQSLRRDLNDIAATADTSTLKGLSYILTETSLALLRHPDYCISSYSHVAQMRSTKDAEKCFYQLSVEEREKFDIETLVNVNDVKIRRTCVPKASKSIKEYIVVTILVAAEGSHKIHAVKDIDSLKEALQYMSSIRPSKTLAVEVLWTPQNDNDSLSKQELLADYPLLRPI